MPDDIRPDVPRKVLITGFGPFPGVPRNISGEVAFNCAEIWTRDLLDRFTVEAHVLPTAWQHAPQRVRACLRASQPDIAMHLGVSARATGIVLERTARNACDGRVDEAGHAQPEGALDPSAPGSLETRAPVLAMRDALVRQGFSATVSDDAGRYLCNAIYHESLTRSRETGAPRHALFIHLPVTLADVGMRAEDLGRALTTVVTMLDEHLAR
ncbi:MAG: hypothetical protein AAFZ01_12360 [Pseudomonadota bacterium]